MSLPLATGLLATGVVLLAVRDGPLLSPDSITYLSAADHLRELGGYTDFTGEPLAHFPPVFPLLLSPGGRSLWWAGLVGAILAGVAAALFAGLLVGRVRRSVAVGGALAFALSQALVRVEATVWSETPYVVAVLATMTLLVRWPATRSTATLAGVAAGLGFLTRYAGAALLLTGLVMVTVAAVLAAGDAHADGRAASGDARRDRRRTTIVEHVVAYCIPIGLLVGGWMARNLVTTGRPLGPHFEGGSGDSPAALVDQVATALGQLVIDLDDPRDPAEAVGYAVLAAVLVGAALLLLRRPARFRRPVRVLDIGVAVFAFSSIAVPVLSRALTGTDVSARILSPVLVSAIFLACIAADRVADRRTMAIGAIACTAVWVGAGTSAVVDGPDRLALSADVRSQFAPRLYDLVAALPPDAHVLTNNPHRVWWHTGREPTHFAFTRPRAGNSHFPISAADTVRLACSGDAYLAWFAGLANAADTTPAKLRPDLAELAEPVVIEGVPGGTLYALRPTAAADCPG